MSQLYLLCIYASKYFLIDHLCKTETEFSDLLAKGKIYWTSSRVFTYTDTYREKCFAFSPDNKAVISTSGNNISVLLIPKINIIERSYKSEQVDYNVSSVHWSVMCGNCFASTATNWLWVIWLMLDLPIFYSFLEQFTGNQFLFNP